jgi:hypothetical protein
MYQTVVMFVDVSNNTSGFNDFNKVGDDYTYDLNGTRPLGHVDNPNDLDMSTATERNCKPCPQS